MKCMKVLVHQQPYKEILRSFGLKKLFSLRWSSSSWFLLGLICLWIATLEVVLPNHTWNMIISSKLCFVIIKIMINQTLVSQNELILNKWEGSNVRNQMSLTIVTPLELRNCVRFIDHLDFLLHFHFIGLESFSF